MAGKAAQAQQIRDLKKQVSGIGTEEMTGIEFTMISPGRAPVTIYAVEDGRPVTIPEYMLGPVMTKTLDDGRFMFVADPKDAPEYKIGDIKCFMHKDSPMREIVDAAGLAGKTCRKSTIPSEHSKRVHGQHRHQQEWAAVQEFIEDRKEEKREKRLDEQLEATLSIARGGTESSTPPPHLGHPTTEGECDVCGKTGLKRVSAHKSMVHKEG